MKVEIECAPCLLHRGYMEILEATNDKALQFQAMSAIIHLLNKEFKPNAVPAHLGTKRDRLLKRITGNTDPYAKKKWLSNKHALEILPQAKQFIAHELSPETRFRRACLCAIVGNVIEFDIPGHVFRFEDVAQMIRQAQEDLAVDEISKIFDAAKKAQEVLYLTDNAGEIAFDKLLVGELKRLGAHITVSVKGKPILDDATIQDAKNVGMQEVADDVIVDGTDTVGLVLKECSARFLSIRRSADLVMAKGMGNTETITETKSTKPHAMLLRTKCQPVANYFGTVKGKNVAKFLT